MAGRPRGNWGDQTAPYTVLGLLVGGLAVWGGIGALLDWAFDLEAVFLPIGLLLGLAGALWLILLRYGKNKNRDDPGSGAEDAQS